MSKRFEAAQRALTALAVRGTQPSAASDIEPVAALHHVPAIQSEQAWQ